MTLSTVSNPMNSRRPLESEASFICDETGCQAALELDSRTSLSQISTVQLHKMHRMLEKCA